MSERRIDDFHRGYYNGMREAVRLLTEMRNQFDESTIDKHFIHKRIVLMEYRKLIDRIREEATNAIITCEDRKD